MKWIRRLLSPVARWYGQNLNDNGSMLRYGRGWLEYGRRRADGSRPCEASAEWCFFRKGMGAHVGVRFSIEDGQDVWLSFGLPYLGSVYFSHRLPRRFLRWILPEHRYATGSYHVDREIRIGVLRDHVSWQIWAHPHGGWYQLSDRTLPKWREGSVFVFDALFGRTRIDERTLSTCPVQIPMIEGSYPGLSKETETTYKRRRWPWWPLTRRLAVYDVRCKVGIPFPGKGENSWDCGDDALYAAGFSARSHAEAAHMFAGSAAASRVRYGGERYLLEPWPETPEERIQKLGRKGA